MPSHGGRAGGRGEALAGRANAHGAKLPEGLGFLSACLIGKTVMVETTNGTVYEGVLFTIKRESSEMHVALKYVQVRAREGAPVHERAVLPMVVIKHRQLACLKATDVRLDAEDIAVARTHAGVGFSDAEISGAQQQRSRKLEAFVFDGSPAPGGGLEDGSSALDNGAGWSGDDMFRQNEAQFGIQSTYDEALYTTALDKSSAGISEREAKEIERRILDQSTTDGHVLEERGLADGLDLTEEERYGAVVRSSASKLPPSCTSQGALVGPPGSARAPTGSAWARGPGAAAGAPPAALPAPAAAVASTPKSEGPGHASKQMLELRKTIADGKPLNKAAPPALRRDLGSVDALNLIPGKGSFKNRPGNNAEVARQLSDYKQNQRPGNNSIANAAAAAVAAVAGGAPAPLSGGQASLAAAENPPGPPSEVAPAAEAAPQSNKPKAFSFNPMAASFKPKAEPKLEGGADDARVVTDREGSNAAGSKDGRPWYPRRQTSRGGDRYARSDRREDGVGRGAGGYQGGMYMNGMHGMRPMHGGHMIPHGQMAPIPFMVPGSMPMMAPGQAMIMPGAGMMPPQALQMGQSPPNGYPPQQFMYGQPHAGPPV